MGSVDFGRSIALPCRGEAKQQQLHPNFHSFSFTDLLLLLYLYKPDTESKVQRA